MLSDADHRILKIIQLEGRITNQELATRCGLSPSACFDRLKRLREQGYILGFHALLDPTKLDRALLIFIEVLMDRTTGDVFRCDRDAGNSGMPYGRGRVRLSYQSAGPRHGRLPIFSGRHAGPYARRPRDPYLCRARRGQEYD